jgi:hypothetical protein
MSVVEYFDFHPDIPVTCPHCGWSGRAGDTYREMSSATVPVLDRECPKCWWIVLEVPFPTFAQTRAAAEAGNEEAIRMCRTQAIDFTEPPPRRH